MIKTFLQWAEEQKIQLPVVQDAPEAQPATTENGKRTGLSANYPAAYAAGQYPHKYFNPVKATADLDIQNIEKKDVKTPKA